MTKSLSVSLPILLVSIFAVGSLRAQDIAQRAKAEVTLVSLEPPLYPPLARQTRISGEVEISVAVRQGGSVESATVIRGHALLAASALDSARQSKFECTNCDVQATPYRLVYSFELSGAGDCPGDKATGAEQPHQRVSQTSNRVTVIQTPLIICDPVVTMKTTSIRSAKCLYLWRCGRHTVYSQ